MGYLIGDPHKAKTQSVYSKQERNPPRATGVCPKLVCPQIRSPTQGGPDASGRQAVGQELGLAVCPSDETQMQLPSGRTPFNPGRQ